MELISFAFYQMLTNLPEMAAYLAGIALSIMHMQRRAPYAPFALAGCVVLLLVTLIFPFLHGYVTGIGLESLPLADLSRRLAMLSLLHALLFATGIALLITAVFTGRAARAVTAESTAASPPRSA
jgi:hypothetical protein